MPTIAGPGSQVQTIKLDAAPAAPYVLQAVVPIPATTEITTLGVRKGSTPTAWFATDWTLVARTKGFNYYLVTAYIESGVKTVYEVDSIDSPQLLSLNETRNPFGEVAYPPEGIINADAWALLNSDGALRLSFQTITGNQITENTQVSLTGGFDTENRMWTSANLSVADSGWHSWSRFERTLYKCIPVVPGGSKGYLHIFARAMAGTPEVQFEVNWHNGGIEERRRSAAIPPEAGSNTGTVPVPFGQARAKDILFSRIEISGFANIAPADGFAGAWVMTPKLQDGGSGPADSAFFLNAAGSNVHALCRQVRVDNSNERNVLPIGFQRHWRFSVHPTGSVTAYGKIKWGVADWTGGGWGFGPLGLPDLSNNPAIDLSAEATNARTRLRQLQSYSVDGHNDGMQPSSRFLPGSYSSYGGETAGKGMWPYYGMKTAWTGEEDGFELLMVEQLRNHSRNMLALYYNVSGHPVHPTEHAGGRVDGPWDHFNQRFLRSGGGPKDSPFLLSTLNPASSRKVQLAAYNPGPAGSPQQDDIDFQPGTAPNYDATPNVPDWYVGGLGNGGPVAGDTLYVNRSWTSGSGLENTDPPAGIYDQAVPVLLQLQGGAAFNNTKSVTVLIEGEGQFDLPASESITLTGPASNPPSIQAIATTASFKRVTSVKVTGITGSLLSTETFTVGRKSVNAVDYHGDNNITPIDDQHAARYYVTDKALALLRWDPIGVLYTLMGAADARLSFWEGTGNAAHFPPERVYFMQSGRGSPLTRAEAWAMDRVASGMAIWNGRLPNTVTEYYWRAWMDVVVQVMNNSRMVNGLWQSVRGKEYKFVPFGSSSLSGLFKGSDEGSTVFYGFAGRELAYFQHGMSMILETLGSEGVHYDALRSHMIAAAGAYKDYLWRTLGGVATGIYNYIPHSIVYRNGQILVGDFPTQPGDVWTTYANQAALPEANPVSGVLINPATPPTVDDDRYVASVNFDAVVAGTPLTLANTQSDTGGPTKLRATITNGTVYGGSQANAKRRTFRIVGTCPLGAKCDDQLFVADTTGDNLAVNTAMALASASPISVGGGQARKVHVSLYSDGGSFTRDDVVTFRIVGTNAQGAQFQEDLTCSGTGVKEQHWRTVGLFASVISITPIAIVGSTISTEHWHFGTPTRLMVLNGNGAATQLAHSYQDFKTITSITMLSAAQAARTDSPDIGTLSAGDVPRAAIKFGTTEVGLRQFSSSFPGLEQNPVGSEGYQLGYGLAVIKHYADLAGSSADIDTCIQRFTSTANLGDAQTAMETWGEYSGGPANRGEQWYPLLHRVQYRANGAPVADFDAIDTTVGAGESVHFRGNLSTGNITDYDWDFGDGTTGTGKFPGHAYAAPGNYTVTLTVTGPGGSDNEQKINYITVS